MKPGFRFQTPDLFRCRVHALCFNALVLALAFTHIHRSICMHVYVYAHTYELCHPSVCTAVFALLILYTCVCLHVYTLTRTHHLYCRCERGRKPSGEEK